MPSVSCPSRCRPANGGGTYVGAAQAVKTDVGVEKEVVEAEKDVRTRLRSLGGTAHGRAGRRARRRSPCGPSAPLSSAHSLFAGGTEAAPDAQAWGHWEPMSALLLVHHGAVRVSLSYLPSCPPPCEDTPQYAPPARGATAVAYEGSIAQSGLAS